MKKYLFAFLALISSTTLFAQISVTNLQSPDDLINNVLAGGGVTIFNVTYNGSAPNAQIAQPQAGYFNANGTTFPLNDGVILSTGQVNDAAQIAITPTIVTTNFGGGGDPDLNMLAPAGTNDAVVIEFDFIPAGDSVSFNFVFASEEYPNYAPPTTIQGDPSNFNDVFGFFLSGPGIAGPYSNGAENIAILPNGDPISIDYINPQYNSGYYIVNTGGTAITYEGMSTVLSTILPTNLLCGQTYHFKIALSDAGDFDFDTAIFLEGNSFVSSGADISIELVDLNGNPLTGNGLIEGCSGAQITFVNPPAYTDSNFVVNVNVSGTATNGTDYTTINPNYTIPPGQDSLTISINAILDGINDPGETLIIETFYISPCGDTITVSDTIVIIDAPPFNVFTSDTLIDCPQATINIGATTNGGIPNLVFDWGAQGLGQTVSVPGNINGTTTYNVAVTDACGVVANGTVNVTLNAAPVPTINFNQNTFTICPGDNAFVDASIVNPYDISQLAYSWAPTGETTEDITVSPSVLTWYILTITDGCYTVSDSVKVDMGTVNLTNINITDATDCPGLGGTPGSINVLPDDPTWTYTLSGGGNTFGPQNNGNFAGLDGGIIYFLNVVNANGCTIDTAITVGLGANAVTATFVLDSLRDVNCFGDNNGGAYIDDITGGAGGTPYNVTWTHTSGLHFQENVAGIPSNPDSEVDDLYGGQWVVTVTDNIGCSWSELFEIIEPAPLDLNLVWNTQTCFGIADGSIVVNASGGNGGYIIDVQDASGTSVITGPTTANTLLPGDYTAYLTDSKGCTTSQAVTLAAKGEINVDLSIAQPACYGIASGYVEVINVYNAQGDLSLMSYFWNPTNPAIQNGIGAYFNNHLGEGTYTLTYSDSVGCSNSTIFTITYPPELEDSIITIPSQCRTFDYQNGAGVVAVSASGGTPGYNYTWTNLATGATSNNSTWGGINTGEYQISIQDNNGCFLTHTVHLDSVSPIASFDVYSAQFLTPDVCEGTAVVDVQFTNTSQHFVDTLDPLDVPTFFWTMDNQPNVPWYLTNDFNEQLDTTYLTAGVYEVCLEVINKYNCVDTACKDMIIHDPLNFTPVNVFTPNGDGINDEFTFSYWAQAVATFQCTIVDRWGVFVYQMNDINDVWLGFDQAGNQMSDGIYYYTYTGVSTDGTAFSGQGFTYILDSP